MTYRTSAACPRCQSLPCVCSPGARPEGRQTREQDVVRIRKITERIVWPKGLRGDADEMGFHVRNLDFLAQRIEEALQAERARTLEECAKIVERPAAFRDHIPIGCFKSFENMAASLREVAS